MGVHLTKNAAPLPLPANDPRVLVSGRPLEVPFRIVAEQYWQEMADTFERMQFLLCRAHAAMLHSKLNPVTDEVWDSIITDIKAELDHE